MLLTGLAIGLKSFGAKNVPAKTTDLLVENKCSSVDTHVAADYSTALKSNLPSMSPVATTCACAGLQRESISLTTAG